MSVNDSQNKQIIEFLEAGNYITGMVALERFGCFRLAARIFDIKKKGYSVESNYVSANGKRFKQYFFTDVIFGGM